ncbi:anhydro-N-acetylmuramic acid kinase [Bradyrhizobium lablabi]|uniref:anhydro-N-acetylmuramic acid kinase n=1 Tax=Bradyrhizobium lablabi TaxID=722472 RepID=UPI001BA4EA83|nr:anhydro-N-acetylmuramic acid kinase [Bradyrhizobium lablabi]MBR1122564.1 anhydro-N-acetylmuramic acid kinase [Bradyrhizobium lablabi]
MMLTALGLMSGTSLDGVDVAMIETDGKKVKAFGPSGYRPYTDRERGLLRQALTEAVHLPQRDARPGILAEAERAVTVAHAEAVAAFTAQNRITREEIDIVGFHGQTVLHRPEKRLTVQIGDGPALAKAIHIPVMHDFRAADVEAGGQGAPFVPVYHRALAQSLEREGPIVVVNIGGVSNITYIDGADTLIACDTGPGNALLDDFMFRVMSQRFDCEGRMAAQGVADEAWIARALELPFFRKPPPKSLDRNDFASLKLGEMKPADGAATLTAFTAAAIARIVPLLPKPPKSWIVAGGGARNLTMLRMLRERLRPATVEAADGLGWASDAIEAQAFGFLAARGLKGLPLSYPATTGVPMPMTGGVIARP